MDVGMPTPSNILLGRVPTAADLILSPPSHTGEIDKGHTNIYAHLSSRALQAACSPSKHPTTTRVPLTAVTRLPERLLESPAHQKRNREGQQLMLVLRAFPISRLCLLFLPPPGTTGETERESVTKAGACGVT